MKHSIVCDLSWGDSGKGSLVDYLCTTRNYRLVVRYNGGAQAGHRVAREDGREHVFHQFGSGTFTPGVDTILSRFMLVDPLAIAREADELEAVGVQRPLSRLGVDTAALVTTPMHASANRLEETGRGPERHGSCGRGIGKTREYAIKYPDDALVVGDLFDEDVTNDKLELLAWRLGMRGRPHGQRELAAAYKRFTDSVWLLSSAGLAHVLKVRPAVFEGAQGVLLDESWGFPPYYTWTDTTPANALTLLAEAAQPRDNVTVFGLTRSYATRHGAGPFPTESRDMTFSFPDTENYENMWQGRWRVGHLDAVALQYALRACKDEVDELVVSCLDRTDSDIVCVGYEDNGRPVTDVPKADTEFMFRVEPVYSHFRPTIAAIESLLKLPVTITSYGPTAADKKER